METGKLSGTNLQFKTCLLI